MRRIHPNPRAVDQRDLANRDAAEANSHRQRDDVQAVQQIVERRRHASILSGRLEADCSFIAFHGRRPP